MAEYAHNPDLLPVERVIPHREPHLWLDGVEEFEPGVFARGFWTPGDEQFEGHFPGQPILQGVQQLEALAQLGCYAAMYSKPGELAVLFQAAEVEFDSPVFPRETLELSVEFDQGGKKSVFEGIGTAAVNGKVACVALIEGRVGKKSTIDKLLQAVKDLRS